MVQLVQLRNRIKAIETIKKITHAMRLISMSTHSRLKHQEDPLHYYKATVSNLFNKVKKLTPEWKNSFIEPTAPTPHTLIILVSSSKGLCGSFNTMLFNHFQWYLQQYNINAATASIITVGTRAQSYINEHAIGTQVISFEELTSVTLSPLAHKITHHIMTSSQPYTSVLVFSNFSKSFFVQKPETTTLVPFNQHTLEGSYKEHHSYLQQQTLTEYRWEQEPDEILDILFKQCMDATLQHILFQSLISEHAARFLSMDNSTRNAQNLLDRTKLDYNKLRQAKITKELSELMGSY